MNNIESGADQAQGEELVKRARRLIPVLIERAKDQDIERRILKETIADLQQAELFRILQPKRWGGFELSPNVFYDVQMALAEGDVSVGWVFGILGVHSFHLALFDDRAATEVWGEDSSVLIASPYAPGKAEPVEGGYRLTGRWKFSSGTEHCAWIFLGGVINRGVEVKHFLDADYRTFLLPRKDYRILDTWDVVGLKGTGSQDIIVDGAFVPEHRTHRVSDATSGTNAGASVNSGILYRYPYWQVFLRCVSSAAIGGLQGMLDAFIRYGSTRISVTGAATVVDPDATLAIAEAKAAIDEMRATLHRNFDRMRPFAERGEMPPLELRLLFKYQCASVPKRCGDIALNLFRASGGSGVFRTQPFGRYYTDILTMANHAANQFQTFGRNWGGILLGQPNTDPVL